MWGLAYLKINLNEKTKRRTVCMTEAEMKDESLSRFFKMQNHKRTVQSIRMLFLFQGTMTFFL